MKPAMLAPPGNLLEMQILRPRPDLLNQKLGGRGLAICLTNRPGDPDAAAVGEPPSTGTWAPARKLQQVARPASLEGRGAWGTERRRGAAELGRLPVTRGKIN